MGIWQNVGQQFGGLAKHAVKTVVQEPSEVFENAVGVSQDSPGENQAMEAIEAGVGTQQSSTNQTNDPAKNGFKTQQDFQKYQQLSGRKDEMELAILRRRLFQENGLDVGLESGMKRASMEYEEKERQRTQVEEQKKEEKKWVVEQKKKEDFSVQAAKLASSAENKAWGAG
jgi:hypothetical protein